MDDVSAVQRVCDDGVRLMVLYTFGLTHETDPDGMRIFGHIDLDPKLGPAREPRGCFEITFRQGVCGTHRGLGVGKNFL